MNKNDFVIEPLTDYSERLVETELTMVGNTTLATVPITLTRCP